MIRFHERFTAPVADCVEATGLSRATIYRMAQRGEIGVKKVGRRTLVDVASLIKALNRTTTLSEPPDQLR